MFFFFKKPSECTGGKTNSRTTKFSMASPPPPTAPNVVSFEPPEGAKVQLEFDTSYANFKVERKADEIGDANFPSNLHNVAELFGQSHMVKTQRTCTDASNGLKTILKKDRMGNRIIAWDKQPSCVSTVDVSLCLKVATLGWSAQTAGERADE